LAHVKLGAVLLAPGGLEVHLTSSSLAHAPDWMVAEATPPTSAMRGLRATRAPVLLVLSGSDCVHPLGMSLTHWWPSVLASGTPSSAMVVLRSAAHAGWMDSTSANPHSEATWCGPLPRSEQQGAGGALLGAFTRFVAAASAHEATSLAASGAWHAYMQGLVIGRQQGRLLFFVSAVVEGRGGGSNTSTPADMDSAWDDWDECCCSATAAPSIPGFYGTFHSEDGSGIQFDTCTGCGCDLHVPPGYGPPHSQSWRLAPAAAVRPAAK